MVCAYARGLPAEPVYSRENTDLPAADVEQPNLNLEAGSFLLRRADHQPVGAQLAPPIERHVGHRAGDRNRAVGIARDHVELALEIQVVPEHLADGLRRRLRLGVSRQRKEIGHRVMRRRAGAGRDDQLHLVLLRRRRRRWLGRRVLGRQQRRAQGGHRSQQCEMSSQHQRSYRKMRWTVRAFSVNCGGSGGSCRVTSSARCAV